MKRILVAMSGGVDSSVAAAILQKDGYDVIGATMKIWPSELCGKEGSKLCCSLKDIEDAKRVCDKLGIRHYVLNLEKVFYKYVVDYFVKEYLDGRTPNPCIVCNEKIKFGALMKKAEALGCDYIGTGHYARIEKNSKLRRLSPANPFYSGLADESPRYLYRLKEGTDKTKDQSYVLFALTEKLLEKIVFPLGDLTKNNVRSIAKDLGLGVHEKPDSQEICFVPNNDYASFIKEYCKIKDKQGNIVDISGKVLGRHKGYWNYTIGQRKGLGIAAPRPLYVMEIKPKENIVVVGEAGFVKKTRFIVNGTVWCNKEVFNKKLDVKIRYNHKKAKAVLKDLGKKRIEIEFKDAQNAITPGQAAVFYDGEYVAGGGWIDEVLSS